MNLFLLLGSVIMAASLLFYVKKLEKNNMVQFDQIKKLIPYAFLGLLLIVAMQSIAPNSLIGYVKRPLMLMSVAIGVITFYMNRDKIGEIEELAKHEKIEEQRRMEEFASKYPRINRVWGLRWFLRGIYKEGKYSVFLALVFILAIALYSYNLGGIEFQEDEFQVVDAAAGYFHNQDFYKWSWLNNTPTETLYTRAWPHSWIIAQSYKFFGISEWSSRIVSVFFGLIFILLSYFIIKFFTFSKDIGILGTITFLFYSRYIDIFRYTRMYALLIPIFFMLLYLGYMSISGTNKYSIINNKISAFIQRNLNFNYLYLTIFLIILLILNTIHINGLVILPSIYLYIVYQAFSKKERKYIVATISGFLGMIFIVFLGLFTKILWEISHFLSFFGKMNYEYLEMFTSYPFPYEVGIVFLSLLFTWMFFMNRSELKNRIIYLCMFIFFSLPFFIFVANRYAAFVYISHITTISIILIIVTYYWLMKVFTNKHIKSVLFILLLLQIGVSFYNGFDRSYRMDDNNGAFSAAYQVIIQNYDPEKEVIIGQYLRPYYIRDIGPKAKIISMGNYQNYSIGRFMDDINKYEGGWITWETRKYYHIQPDIIDYIDQNFKKYHGEGIDNTSVEVYYFNQTMVKK